MKSLLTGALAFCALLLILVSPTRRAPRAHARFSQEAARTTGAKSADTFTVRELDLEGLNNILQRGGAAGGQETRPLLLNFWATWCEPCREEFPDLIQIEADYRKRGLEMVFISLDDISDIKTTVPQFLREMKADKLPSYLLNVPDPEPAIKSVDAEWRGALPATFIYDARGQMVFKHTGRIKPAELRAALDAITKKS